MSPQVTATAALVVSVLLATASLAAMVIVVSNGGRGPVVAAIEVATWTAATVWLPVVAWRYYRRVTQDR